MKLLNEYFKLQKEIYEYFGYKETWTVYPLSNCTGYYWRLINEQSVRFAEDLETLNSEEGDYYENHRYPPVWIYREKEYTMLCVDTQTDQNKFLSIFDNSKEQTND